MITTLMLNLLLATPGSTDTGELEQALALLDTLDRTTISMDYESERLADVAIDLAERLPMPLRLDERALDRIGVSETDRVTLHLPDSTASSALSALMLVLGDQFEAPVYEVHAGQIVLTSRSGTEPMRLTGVYDVRDLTVDGRAASRLRREQADRQSDGGQDERPEPDREAEPPPTSSGMELMRLVQDHVDPDAWIELGGASATISERDGVLLVTAPPTTHRRFQATLRRLRLAFPTSVALEVTVIEIEADERARLARRHTAGSAGLLAALRSSALITHWKTSAVDVMGETYRVESAGDDVSLLLELVPRLDRATGQVEVDVHLVSVAGDDRREVRTTVPIDGGGVVIDVPAAAAGGTERLLLLTHSR